MHGQNLDFFPKVQKTNSSNFKDPYVPIRSTKKSSDLYSLLGHFRDKTSFILDDRKYKIIEIGMVQRIPILIANLGP